MAKFHFSGVCGAGMGNVACLLAEAGHEIKGSDEHMFPPMSEQLQESSVLCYSNYGADRVTEGFVPDVQVIANVLPSSHEEVLAGQEAGLKQMSFPEVLETFVLPGKKPYVVAGTHGKTTTSSILSHLLKSKGAGSFVGGVMKDGAPGCRLGGEGKPFVLEGDEYDTAFFDKHSKFLHYAPQVCVLTHLEWDHVDIFPHFEDMVAEFEALVKLLPPHGKIIYCGDHDVLKRLVSDAPCPTMSYGFEDHNDVVLHAVERVDGIQQLTVQFRDQEVCIRTKLMGRIYYLNLVGAWCAAHWGEEMGHDELQRELGDFAGARRRLEVIREDDRVLISDFAHHPTSVQETISIVKENWPDQKLIAIFDPRNATSRRKIFEDRLVEALALADEVHLAPPPLDKRLDESERLDVVELSHRIGKKAFGYESGEDFVEAVLKASSPECVVLVMSCGSCYGCIQRLWKHESLS